jgi:hypothetical protein
MIHQIKNQVESQAENLPYWVKTIHRQKKYAYCGSDLKQCKHFQNHNITGVTGRQPSWTVAFPFRSAQGDPPCHIGTQEGGDLHI